VDGLKKAVQLKIKSKSFALNIGCEICGQYLLMVYYAITICGMNVSVYFRKIPCPATCAGSILSKICPVIFK
jgi:hypothetical protein